jgi:GAF domain-containing protein
MIEVPSSLPRASALGSEAIASAMFLSQNLEDLLKIFLVGLAENLAANRVAIYHLQNDREGEILVEAVSPDILSIKNKIYPIAYFGIDSLKNYPCDRIIIMQNTAEKNSNPTIHHYWQRIQVKSMMTVQILLNSASAIDLIWGFVVVQQCQIPHCNQSLNQSRIWQSQDADILLELSQVLGQCMYFWQLSLKSSDSPQWLNSNHHDNNEIIESDREEFLAKRVEVTQKSDVKSSNSNLNIEEIAILNNFISQDEEESELFDKDYSLNNQNYINNAINFALQNLDDKKLSISNHRYFVETNSGSSGFEGINV